MIEMEFTEGAAVYGCNAHGQEVLKDAIVVLQDAVHPVVVMLRGDLAVGIVVCVLALTAAELAVRPAGSPGNDSPAVKAPRQGLIHSILGTHTCTFCGKYDKAFPLFQGH